MFCRIDGFHLPVTQEALEIDKDVIAYVLDGIKGYIMR